MADIQVDPGALLSQMLVEQGRQGAQLAAISEQLKDLPDHELRLRALERFRWTLAGVSTAAGAGAGFLAWLLTHLTH